MSPECTSIFDEHINSAVAEGLRRRGIDVTTAVEAGLLGKSDSEHLEFARRSTRVMVTGDADFLALSNAGVEHCGLVFCPADRGIGRIIEFLVLVDACLDEADMRNHVEFA